MLRNLFTEFDKLCQKYNVYKMYTIGDCYVVMGFTNSAKRNVIYVYLYYFSQYKRQLTLLKWVSKWLI